MKTKTQAGKNIAFCVAGLTLLAGCTSVPHQPSGSATTQPATTRPATPQSSQSMQNKSPALGRPSPYTCNYTSPARASGNFYKDDGPLDLPDNLDQILEPLPRDEPLHRWANNPYTVLGQTFVPRKTAGDYTGRGIGSWYGRKFHGQKTSSGETYDMFQMTAAHPTLPIPSYVRVTNLKNQRSVIVRVNDRGPFLKGREIDLSFLAACRLGYAMNGSAEVEVVSLLPGDVPDEPGMVIPDQPVEIKPLPEAVTALPTVTPPVRTEPLTGNEVFLQLGAFSSRTNAENFHAHLARELDDGQAGRLGIQQAGTLYRVRLGPFPDRASALAEAEKLTGKKNLAAIVTR